MTQTHTLTDWLKIAMDHHQRGQIAQAEQIYRAILARQPEQPDALHLLGILAGQQNHPEQAVDLITRAVAARPNVGAFHANLAQALIAVDRDQDAVAEYRKAIALDPNYFPAHYGLGTLLEAIGRADEAITAYQNALKIQPNHAESHNNLAIAFRNAGRWDEAEAEIKEAERLLPKSANVQTNLAMLRLDTARHAEAIAAYDRALSLEPPTAERLSSRIAAMHYDPRFGPAEILAAAREYDEIVVRPLASLIVPHTNLRDPNRKLRIGYVSPDLRNHVVGRCMLPVIVHHDRTRFETYCYASVTKEDDISTRLREQSHKWLNVDRFDDESVAEAIRADQIDILVDLAVHTLGNRLPVFARKPAPVQITWLGYCSTTGVSTIDYRISDPFVDPVETDLTLYSEKTIRLAGTQFCYEPFADAPPVSPLPAAASGSITFGCLNNFTKDSAPAIDAWIKILQAVPTSRIIIHARPGKHLETLALRFQAGGVSPDRVQFVGQAEVSRYLRTYANIDIALDPFPYNGGITSCDAIYMGVPIITLSGKTAVGRMGRCILSNIDLPELVADSVENYVRVAVEWAKDIHRLARLRRELRPRLQTSPLMNPQQFTRNLEVAYRQVWQTWCGQSASPDSKS